MFELSENLEATAITDIGIDGRSAMVIDNFYENPEEVRRLALKLDRKKDIPFSNHPNGIERAAYQTDELRKNIEHVIKQICHDDEHWGRTCDRPTIDENMSYMWFLVEYLNEKTMTDQPDRLIPFQLWYEHNPSPFQFKIEIYLNHEEECFGGTNLWNFAGRTSVVEDMKAMYATKKHFDIIKDVYDSKFTWGREFTFGMKFNRAIIIPADILQSPIMNTGKFTDVDRITQAIFL
jgi:hypothetical protein|tara:strand:+ start:22191 stop:22895 length:705 start_codon:yes stop_codon:yes gene_type:complete